MNAAPEGLNAFRAWRRVPRAIRKEYASGESAAPDHAWAALGYGRFAVSGLGLLIYLGSTALMLVGVSVAMALMGIGPDGLDLLLFAGVFVFTAFNHVRTADRIRGAANHVLGPQL